MAPISLGPFALEPTALIEQGEGLRPVASMLLGQPKGSGKLSRDADQRLKTLTDTMAATVAEHADADHQRMTELTIARKEA